MGAFTNDAASSLENQDFGCIPAVASEKGAALEEALKRFNELFVGTDGFDDCVRTSCTKAFTGETANNIYTHYTAMRTEVNELSKDMATGISYLYTKINDMTALDEQ